MASIPLRQRGMLFATIRRRPGNVSSMASPRRVCRTNASAPAFSDCAPLREVLTWRQPGRIIAATRAVVSVRQCPTQCPLHGARAIAPFHEQVLGGSRCHLSTCVAVG
jgi:hypothetical protein